MRKRRILDSETRRLVMAALCRLRCGDDGWLDIDPVQITLAVLLLLAFVVCGCEAKGDVLCWWADVDSRVSPEVYSLAVEIGPDLSGPGKPLGWIEFRSTRERGPEVIVGSWSDAYGTDGGLQTIRLHATERGTAELVSNGAYILDAMQPAEMVNLWDGETAFPDGMAYVLFDWSSYVAPTGGGAFGQRYSGRGWISIDSIVTEYADPGMNDKPSYIVRQIALGTSVYQAGQLLAAVPEPGTWVVLAVVCVCAALWRARA